MQAASFWTFLCKRSCCMPVASLIKLDTTSQSWLVLPKTQGVTGYRCVCAHLYEEQISIGVNAVTEACCEPFLQSSTEQ